MEKLKHAEASWNNPAIDLSGLLARVEYDRELLHEMLDTFRREFPQVLSSLQEAVTRSDEVQIQNNAHTLKGMLGSLSFLPAAEHAIRIERLSTERRFAAVPAEIAALQHDANEAQHSLEILCNGGAA